MFDCNETSAPAADAMPRPARATIIRFLFILFSFCSLSTRHPAQYHQTISEQQSRSGTAAQTHNKFAASSILNARPNYLITCPACLGIIYTIQRIGAFSTHLSDFVSLKYPPTPWSLKTSSHPATLRAQFEACLCCASGNLPIRPAVLTGPPIPMLGRVQQNKHRTACITHRSGATGRRPGAPGHPS